MTNSLLAYGQGKLSAAREHLKPKVDVARLFFAAHAVPLNQFYKPKRGINLLKECRISTRDENNEIHALDFRVMATPHLFENELFTIFSLVNIGDEKRRRIFERIFFHDITNTAGAIHGLAEIMVETSSLEESEQHELTELLSSASNQLMDEIQGQQQLMAAENGELLIEPKHFNTKRFIQSLIQIYKNHPVAENKDMGIDPNLANVLIMSDQAILGRVIGNMIKNALEACAPQEVVTIGCYKIDDQVRFWVHNAKYIPEQNPASDIPAIIFDQRHWTRFRYLQHETAFRKLFEWAGFLCIYGSKWHYFYGYFSVDVARCVG